MLNSERREFQNMELNSEKREKCEKYTHVEFIDIYNYLSDKTYPEHITDNLESYADWINDTYNTKIKAWIYIVIN